MNFDEAREEREARDRTFVMGGETFTAIAAVDMEVIARYEDSVGKGNSQDYAALLEATILEFLVPEDRERWQKMRERVSHSNGVTFGDAGALMRWLLERDAQRPTELPSSSSDSEESGPASSEVAPSSPEAIQTP